MSLRPGMPSAGLSARKPGPDHKAINPNRLPTVFLRRMDCDLHEIGWIQEDWKHEYPSSRQVRLLEVRMQGGNQGEVLQ